MEKQNITRALSMIGLCKKAGRLAIGVPMVVDALREGKLYAVVYASFAAENSLKRVKDKAKSYEVCALALDVAPEELGHSVGKTGAVAAVGITDSCFAEAVKKIISD